MDGYSGRVGYPAVSGRGIQGYLGCRVSRGSVSWGGGRYLRVGYPGGRVSREGRVSGAKGIQRYSGVRIILKCFLVRETSFFLSNVSRICLLHHYTLRLKQKILHKYITIVLVDVNKS